MKKIYQGRALVTLAAILSLAFLSSGAVNAIPNAHAEDATGQTTTGQTAAAEHATARTTAAEKVAAAKTRLAEAQLKVCQVREKAITNIMTRIADRGTKQLALFTTIADRAEAFYKTKGKTLSNYDALVGDVTTAKANAETAVSAITTSSTSFSCDGTDPKGVISTFKASLKSEISALQAYRTAVKNLIVGVKSVESTTASSKTSDTTSGTSDNTSSSTTTTTTTTNGVTQ